MYTEPVAILYKLWYALSFHKETVRIILLENKNNSNKRLGPLKI